MASGRADEGDGVAVLPGGGEIAALDDVVARVIGQLRAFLTSGDLGPALAEVAERFGADWAELWFVEGGAEGGEDLVLAHHWTGERGLGPPPDRRAVSLTDPDLGDLGWERSVVTWSHPAGSGRVVDADGASSAAWFWGAPISEIDSESRGWFILGFASEPRFDATWADELNHLAELFGPLREEPLAGDEVARRRWLEALLVSTARFMWRPGEIDVDSDLQEALTRVGTAFDLHAFFQWSYEDEEVVLQARWTSTEDSPFAEVVGPAELLPVTSTERGARSHSYSSPAELPGPLGEALRSVGLYEVGMIHLPVVLGADVVGAVALVTADRRRWTREELSAVASVARMARVFLRRRDDEVALRARARDAQVLAELGQRLLAAQPGSASTALVDGLEMVARHVSAQVAVYYRRVAGTDGSGDSGERAVLWMADGVTTEEALAAAGGACQWDHFESGVLVRWANESGKGCCSKGARGFTVATTTGGRPFGLVVLARIDGQDLDPAHTALVEAAATEIGQLCLREETGDRLARRTELSEVRARVAASLVDTRAGDLDRAVTDTLVIVGSALSASTVGWVPLSDRGALWVRDGIPVAHASAPDTAAGSIRAAIARRSDGAAFRFDTSDTGVDGMTGDAAALTVVPVVGRDEVVAAIVVTESGERPRPGVDLDLLTDIGGLIHQLDLRVAAESERDIRWRHDDLHARVMRRLLAPGIDDPSAVLDWAMAEIGRMLEADSVRFVDLDGDMVVPKGSWSSVPHPLIDRFEQPRARAECPLGEVALTDGSACVVRQGDLGDSSQEMLGELGVDDLIAIVVPIRGLGPAAALTVVALTGRPWGETEAKSMAELAAEIRQFLDGAQVRGDLQARLDLEDLHSLIAGALVSVDHHRADEVFDWVLSELVDQMGAAWACLLAIDDEAEAAVEVTRVWSPADPVELELEGLAERLRAVGASDETAVRLGPRGVAVAILSDGEVVGALCLAPRDDRALDPAELDILHSVGRLLHVARQRMAAELALSRRADLEDLIARAAAMLVEADDPEDIMAMVLGEIARFFGAVDVSWMVVDPELHQLRRAHVWPAAHGGPARSASAPFELGEEEWSWLWDSLRAPTVLAEHDIAPELRRRWGDHRGESLEGLPDQGCRSTTFICVPVFSGGRPTALLVVDTAAREGWSAASIRPLQALATVAREVFAKARVDRLFSTTFRSAPTGQLLLSDDGVIRAANESFSRLVGGDPVGRPLFELVEGAESSWWPSEGEFKLAVDHSVSWVRFRSAVAHVRGDADPLTIVHVEDVTADRRHRERLRFEATHDDLTGLGNRRLLMEALADQMESGGGAVLLIDVDRFKVVNDSLGHSAGDAVLVRIADRLRLSIRDVDEVCRFGGDEFAVLLRSVDEGHEIAATAHRLIEVIRRPVEVRGTTVMPTCSVGIARWSGDDDVESVIRHADAALYEAKGRGRDRYEFFDDARRQSLRERLALETSLRKGVLDRRFLPWYQPELDLETGEVVGFEALVRWDHPGRGLLPAGAFIEVAEEIGLAPEMSRLVLEESCAALRRWNDAGADVSVRVNIASAQLQTDELEHQIRDALERHRLRPHQLCLEITERSLMLDLSTSVGTLERIRSLGVKVAIDDFGTGFSSLAWLKGLPVDTLKIDRSFVSGLTSGRTDREIVRTIIWLARALGLDVVAEGVEEERELAILRGLGCRRAQGWLWSPAVPEEQVLEILASV